MLQDKRNALSLADQLDRVSRRYPDHVAIRFLESIEEHGPEIELTYARFVQRIRATANLFAKLASTRPNIALIVPNTPEAQIALWAAEVAGKAMPINPLLPDDHVGALLRAAGSTILIVESDLERTTALRKLAPDVSHVFTLDSGPFCIADSRQFEDRDHFKTHTTTIHHDPVIAQFHTGGTTGVPKLALHKQSNQMSAALGAIERMCLVAGDIIINPLPLFHVAGSICIALAPILAGACQLLVTRFGGRTPGFFDQFWPIVSRHSVSIVAGVPTIISEAAARLPEIVPASVRLVVTGGAALSPAIEKSISLYFGTDVLLIYGMTETAGFIASRQAGESAKTGWLGQAAPGVEIRVRSDPESLDSSFLGTGVQGHIVIRGVTVGPGYANAKLNAGLFTADGWLKTGDLGVMDADGQLRLTGRAKDIIIRSGHNLEASAIEEAALEHPSLIAAAAVGAPDAYAGEVPALFVQAKPGHKIDQNELLNFLSPLLERPAIPKYLFVLEQLPLTAAGKVYKPELAALATEQVLQAILANDKFTWTAIEADGRVVVRVEDGEHRERITTLLEPLMLQLEFF